jgi:hypothetical protein
LTAYQVDTAIFRHWDKLANGALLAQAEPEYDVLLTSDQSLRYQQNLAGRRISIIILPSNRLPALLPLLPEIKQALTDAKPGGWTEIQRRGP